MPQTITTLSQEPCSRVTLAILDQVDVAPTSGLQ